MAYDFSGWATRNNIKCSDGRTIMQNAFKDQDGATVPLVWNHQHNGVDNVLGHALLENRAEGVYAYCSFNDTQAGRNAKTVVDHGDVVSLSIYANRLKQRGADVVHGAIREVSLVLAGANPGAFIDSVIRHGEASDEEAVIYSGKHISIYHADNEKEGDNMAESEETVQDVIDSMSEKQRTVMYALIGQALEGDEGSDDDEPMQHSDGETVQDVIDSMSEKQRTVMYALIGQALEDAEGGESMQHSDDDETIADIFNTLTDKQKDVVYGMIGQVANDGGISASDYDDADDADDYDDDDDYDDADDDGYDGDISESDNGDSEGGNSMKHNVFENDAFYEDGVLCHADEVEILNLAKQTGKFQDALAFYAEENGLSHADAVASGFAQTGEGNIYNLFPEYKEVRPGAPELITNDQGWVSTVMNKVHKSPISRIRTSQVDIRKIEELRAHGYEKGKQKSQTGNFSLIRRTTDPQTVYVKSALHRDDIIDITDFDYVQYLYKIDKMQLNEELATAIMLGDGREDGAEDKIQPTHIRPIWTDDDLYTIHVDLDKETVAKELQGEDTTTYFGDNFVTAEAMVNTVLYAREKFKGTGTPDMYITPHMLNVMLLARDRNGHRIYSSKAELATALNVGAIHTAEQFEGKTRKLEDGGEKKLLALIVNLADYSLGATKGGEVTHFTQFDIDFNQQKSLLETRCSGALTRVYSAIAVEEPVAAVAG